MRRVLTLLVIVIAAVALAYWLKGRLGSPASSPIPITTEDRIPKLMKQIAEQEEESAHAVANYAPATGVGRKVRDQMEAAGLVGLPLVALAWEDYVKPLPAAGVTVEQPMKRLGIGEQNQWIKKANG